MDNKRVPSIVLLMLSGIFSEQITQFLFSEENEKFSYIKLRNLKTELTNYLNSFRRTTNITLRFADTFNMKNFSVSFETINSLDEDDDINSYVLKVDLRNYQVNIYQLSLGGKEILINTIST